MQATPSDAIAVAGTAALHDSAAPAVPNAGGHQVRLVTLCGTADVKSDAVRQSQDILEELFAQRGMAVRPVDLGDWSLAKVPALLRAIRQERPDVILMQYPSQAFGSSFGPLALIALHRGAPVVVMVHEFVDAHPLRKLSIGALTARATLVATTAERQAERLGQWFPWLRGRFRRISISSNVPTRPWTPEQPSKISYFGQLRPNKGLKEFLLCQAAISPVRPDVRFEIVGATIPKFADYGNEIMAEAQAQGVDLVIDREIEQVADVLCTATVALLPFPDGASFRRSSLLAVATCGVPVVTTTGSDTPAELRPFIENAVTVEDLTALALKYLGDPQSRQQAHERSLRLAEGFGWSDAVDRYVAAFDEARSIARGKGAPTP